MPKADYDLVAIMYSAYGIHMAYCLTAQEWDCDVVNVTGYACSCFALVGMFVAVWALGADDWFGNCAVLGVGKPWDTDWELATLLCHTTKRDVCLCNWNISQYINRNYGLCSSLDTPNKDNEILAQLCAQRLELLLGHNTCSQFDLSYCIEYIILALMIMKGVLQ